MAFIIGILAAHQFKFSGAGASMIGISAMLGSGAIQMNANGIALKGIGDIINVILVIIIACALYLLLQGKFVWFFRNDYFTCIYSSSQRINWINDFAIYTNYHKSLGHVINSFTEFNPLIMSILISVTFSLLMVTPISLVAIATAISLNGLGSGAANMGIVAACVTFSLVLYVSIQLVSI